MIGIVDGLGAIICWLFNLLKGEKKSLKEEFEDTYATKHLVVGFLTALIINVLWMTLYIRCS